MEFAARKSGTPGAGFWIGALLLAALSLPTSAGADMPRFERLPPVSAGLHAPTALALDRCGNTYVVESSSDRLLVYAADGGFLGGLLDLDRPVGVAVDAAGQIFVSNAGRYNVEVYDRRLALRSKLGTGDGAFAKPGALAVGPAGEVYVVDSKANAVHVFPANGAPPFRFGDPSSGDGQFNFPTAVAVDGARQEVFVVDLGLAQSPNGAFGAARTQVFDLAGNFKRKFGSYGVGEGNLIRPLGIALDGAGRVYISDSFQNVVQVFVGDGAYLGAVYDSAIPLRTPLGLAFCRASNRLFVASSNTAKVEVFGIDTYLPGGENPPSDSGEEGCFQGHLAASLPPEDDGAPASGGSGETGGESSGGGGGACFLTSIAPPGPRQPDSSRNGTGKGAMPRSGNGGRR